LEIFWFHHWSFYLPTGIILKPWAGGVTWKIQKAFTNAGAAFMMKMVLAATEGGPGTHRPGRDSETPEIIERLPCVDRDAVWRAGADADGDVRGPGKNLDRIQSCKKRFCIGFPAVCRC
jgi:hypothetical protein